jgi:hypothetical protein
MISVMDKVGLSGVKSMPSTKEQVSKTKPTLQAKMMTPKIGVPGQVTCKS